MTGLRTIWVGVLVAVLCAGCARAPEDAGDTLQVLRKGNSAEPETLDPATAEGVAASHVQRDLFEGLVAEGPDGSIVPGVAERWETSPDGLTWTFHLRGDARWSDGSPVTADDFVWSLRRVLDPRTGSEYGSNLAPLQNAAEIIAGKAPPESLGVAAPDERTVVLSLRGPTPYLLGLLTNSSAYPVHRASVEQHGTQFTRPGKLVTNGAYQLTEWVPHSHLRLTRNPHYWDAATVRIDEVWYHPIDDQAAELKRYRAGELDWTYEVPLPQLAWIRENLGDELHIAPWLGSFYLGVNTTVAPFSDVRVRRALSMAIDRETLTGKVIAAGETAAYGLVPPVNDYSPQRPDWAEWPLERRREAARALLTEAGFGPGKPLRVELLVNTHANYQRICLAVAAMWKESLGVETEVINLEWKVYLEKRKTRAGTQLFRAGWVGDYNDPYAFAELLRSDYGIDDTGWDDATYDALLDRAAASGDAGERRALLEAAEKHMLDAQPVIPLYFYATRRLVKPHVKGWQPNIMDHHYTKYLWLEPAAR